MDSKAAITSEAKLEPSIKPEANDENISISSIPATQSALDVKRVPSVGVTHPTETQPSIKSVARVNESPTHPGGVSKVKAPDTRRSQKIRETIKRIQESHAADPDHPRMKNFQDSVFVTSGAVCHSCGYHGHRKHDEACMNYNRDQKFKHADTHRKVEYLEEELFHTRVELKDLVMDTQKLVMHLLEEKMGENEQTTE